MNAFKTVMLLLAEVVGWTILFWVLQIAVVMWLLPGGEQGSAGGYFFLLIGWWLPIVGASVYVVRKHMR